MQCRLFFNIKFSKGQKLIRRYYLKEDHDDRKIAGNESARIFLKVSLKTLNGFSAVLLSLKFLCP